MRAPSSAPDLAVGIFVLLLGALGIWQAAAIPVSPIYAQVGPTVVPYAVGAGLLLLGLLLTGSALRGGWSHDLPEVAEAAPANWRALALLGAGLLVNLALIDWLGFVIAATAQFVLIAAAFSSKRPLRDLVVGVLVTLAAYEFFGRVLGVNIGAGVLEGIL